MQSYCRNFRGIVHNEYQQDKHKFARVRCKMWSCPYCWRVNQAQWRAVLFKQLPAISDVWSFHTITLKAKDHKDGTTAKRIRENWDKLSKRLKRAFGDYSYVRVLEQHKSGQWHIHLLASFHIEANDLKTVLDKDGAFKYQYSALMKRKILPECGFGTICSVSNLLPTAGSEDGAIAKAIGYVTKYMTKRDDSFEVSAKDHKVRIIQTSRDIKFTPEKSDEIWQLKSGIYQEEIMRGEIWVDINRGGEIVTLDHFQDDFIYPNDAQIPSTSE